MGTRNVRFDDLDGLESDEVETHKFTIDGVEVDPLDLRPVNFAAIEAFLVKRDPTQLQAVFAPATVARRTHEEIEAIRDAARAARNADGTEMFDVKPTGRVPNAIETWYETVYLPAQEAANATPEASEGNAEGETTTKRPAAKK